MSIDQQRNAPQEVACSYHPNVQTLLRCSRCGKPICPKCGVRTPVGIRCPDCAGVRGLPTYKTESGNLLRAAAGALVVALTVGVVWGFFPTWQFYLTLALGFGVAETVARFGGNKRGLDLQLVGWGAVLIGLVVSRVVLAQRLDLSWSQISDFSPFVEAVMYLDLIPDGLFALIPFIIVFIRFK